MLAISLAATGSVLSGLHDWGEALKPGIMGGLIAQVAIAMRAMYVDKPESELKKAQRVAQECEKDYYGEV